MSAGEEVEKTLSLFTASEPQVFVPFYLYVFHRYLA